MHVSAFYAVDPDSAVFLEVRLAGLRQSDDGDPVPFGNQRLAKSAHLAAHPSAARRRGIV
jgi:hypothetical protein